MKHKVHEPCHKLQPLAYLFCVCPDHSLRISQWIIHAQSGPLQCAYAHNIYSQSPPDFLRVNISFSFVLSSSDSEQSISFSYVGYLHSDICQEKKTDFFITHKNLSRNFAHLFYSLLRIVYVWENRLCVALLPVSGELSVLVASSSCTHARSFVHHAVRSSPSGAATSGNV